MDYIEESKKIKKIDLTSELLVTLYSCIQKFWNGNYYRYSEETQQDIKVLKQKLDKKNTLNTNDIAIILWILDIYGYEEIMVNMIANCESYTDIDTNYL